MTNQPPERSGAGDHDRDDEREDEWDEAEAIDPDTIVELTEEGQTFFRELLAVLSSEVGRPLTADDLKRALAKARADVNQHDPRPDDAGVMDRFLKYLREGRSA